MTLPVFLSLSLWYSKNGYKSLYFVSFLIGLIALCFTRQRGPLISTIVGMSYVICRFYFFKLIKNPIKILVSIIIGFIIIILSFTLGGKNSNEIFYRKTYLGRIDQMEYVISTLYNSKLHNQIFGMGPGQYVFQYYELDNALRSLRTPKNIYNIHNQYLLVIYESGILGLLLYLLWLVSIFKASIVRNNFKDCKLSFLNPVYKIGIHGSVVSFIILSISEPLHENICFTIFALYMAVLSITPKIEEPHNLLVA